MAGNAGLRCEIDELRSGCLYSDRKTSLSRHLRCEPFSSDDEEGGDWVEGEGQLSSLIPVRAELARGDLRALYLGWLLRVQAGEIDGNRVERYRELLADVRLAWKNRYQ